MDWPKDLLDIFDEPEFANTHPISPKMTADDRIKEAFLAINEWYSVHRREPSIDADRPERTYAMQLKGIRETDWKREYLRTLDEFNLLDGEV
ncbi:hypothetical protein [Massilibacteroides sp.]|uniref:hypothetical protein n=1 Tax=Massilibacteroides sp. TaxID=2034766 RepID=UPI00260EC823|nr:hypothetical protein [Massilibacteroides sp.]MDD4514829.1 hypothetical protein [Massilibacteroides sp.]